MFSPATLFSIILAYLTLLFLVAYYAERKEKQGSSLVSNPYVYSLSLAVYCSSWTFYGSVGEAANTGLTFLAIYIGPTLMAALWWVVLRKIVYICKENRITTISDFIASRYGNSLFLSALVTVVAVVGVTPYLGLQLKAVMTTFSILAGKPEENPFASWFITLILGVFAIFFGARKVDVSERHGGLIFAVAFESAIKVVAFISVGLFVAYGLFDGIGNIFEKVRDSRFFSLMLLGQDSDVSFTQWTSLTFVSMMAIMFLPRQFYVSVVENSSYEHIKKAMWLFPLYLLLMNIFVLPIAYGGLLLGEPQHAADFFVLTIPLKHKVPLLALFAFIGGFSAATAMVIVESLALSTMIMNSLVMPALLGMNAMKGFHIMILNTRRIIIIGLVFLGYAFAVYIGYFYSLVDIGLTSFEAVTIFAPSLLIGLYWRGGNKNGAIAGILAGFTVWIYTLMIPVLMRAGIITGEGFWAGVLGSSLLNPVALFGLKGLDRWSHSLFWELLFNSFFYFGVSIFTNTSGAEERQALKFVESYSSGMLPNEGSYDAQRIEDVLGQCIGSVEAREFVENFLTLNGIRKNEISQSDLIRMRDEAEKILSGALGSPVAAIIFEDKLKLTKQERGELSNSIKQMTNTLRLSRKELADANRNLAYLKEFSENIIESAPVGIVSMDSHFKVKSWNKKMEAITGIKRFAAFDESIVQLLPWLRNDTVLGSDSGEEVVQTASMEFFKVNISSLKDPSGGFVVLIEDITDKKKMEEQLLHSSRQLIENERLAAIGLTSAKFAHEIANPLNGMAMTAQLLERYLTKQDSLSDEKVSSALQTIKTEIRHLNALLSDFRFVYRRETYNLKPTPLNTIVEEILTLQSPEYTARGIQVEQSCPEDLPLIMADEAKLKQAVLNLCKNAAEAMPNGGKIIVRGRSSGDEVLLEVEDTGIGIPDGIDILEPFATTKPSGTGLGLVIVRQIVAAHKGTMTYASELGKGTVFTVSLPAARVAVW